MFDLNRDGFTDVQDIILICVAITSILAATYALRRQIVKPVSTWVQKQFRETVLETITPTIDRIEHEVTANDGSSLKDLVRHNHDETLGLLAERDKAFARLAGPADQRVRHLEAAVKALNSNQSEILTRLDALSGQIDRKSADIIEQTKPSDGS